MATSYGDLLTAKLTPFPPFLSHLANNRVEYELNLRNEEFLDKRRSQLRQLLQSDLER